MASGIQNAQDLIAVLDAIYDNTSQMDTYTGADGTTKGSLRLYYNEISKTATIFKKTTKPLDPLDPVITNVVATFNPENIVTNDKTFITKVMKNVVVSNHSAYANDVGVGAFVDVKTLIRNICAALGVNMAANFDELNSAYYEEMVAIVHKYYGDELVNNAPYGLAKKVETVEGQDVATYHSYIPVMIIVEIAIFLNNLGIFVTDIVKPENGSFTSLSGLLGTNFTTMINAANNTDIRDFVPAVEDIYTLKSKNKFKEDCRNLKNSRTTVGYTGDSFDNLLNSLLNEYEPEIDFVNNVVVCCGYFVNDYCSNVKFVVFSKNSWLGCSGSTNTRYKITNKYDDFAITTYTATLNTSTQEITNTKTITGYLKYAVADGVLYNSWISNINCNKIIATYTDETITYSNRYYRQIPNSYLGQLQNNIKYEDIKLTSMKINSDTAAQVYLLNKKYNLFNGDKDLVVSNGSKLYIFKNVTTINSDAAYYLAYTYGNYIYNGSKTSSAGSWTELYYPNVVSTGGGTYIRNKHINFYEDIAYEIYDISNGYNTPSLVDSGTTDDYTFTENIYSPYTNLGTIVELDDEGIQGLTLQDGATYPTTVVDYPSWLTTYPDWQRIGYSQPFFEDDVITNTYNAQWAAITVSQDPPTEQDDGQSGKVDLDDVDDVIDDIDQAEEDSDEPPTDPNSDGDDDNTGDTPSEDSLSELPNAITSGLIKQYMLTTSEMQDFAEALIRPDTWTALNMLLANPIDAIISLQSGYLFNTQGATSQYMTFNGYTFSDCTATKLATNYLSMDLGTINIQPYFDTYQDVLNSELEIFLPYIGYITLDISEFLGGSIHLRCRVDTLTGIILYSIYCVRDGHEQLVQQVNGNCQVQLPINSSDYHALFRALSGKVGQ